MWVGSISHAYVTLICLSIRVLTVYWKNLFVISQIVLVNPLMDLAKGDVEVFCNLLLSDIVLVYIDFYFLEKFEILALCAESVDSALGNRLSTISAYLAGKLLPENIYFAH